MVMSAHFIHAVLFLSGTSNQGKIMVIRFFGNFFGKTDIFSSCKRIAG